MFVYGRLPGSSGCGSGLEKLSDDAFSCVRQLIMRYHSADQADLERLGSRDGPGGQGEIFRPCQAHDRG